VRVRPGEQPCRCCTPRGGIRWALHPGRVRKLPRLSGRAQRDPTCTIRR
jgi:hypothetical protein